MTRSIHPKTLWPYAVFAALCAVFAMTGVASAQTLTLAAHYGEAQQEVLQPCFERYREETGVTVEYQQIAYGDYLQTILTARIGGQSPDIYHIYNIWGPQLVDNNVLAVPPEEVLEFVRSTYIETTVTAATINDQVWGIPTEVSNYMLVYNRELLEAAGYDEPPATWDELVEIAAAITERDAQGRISQAGYAFGPSMANVVHPFLTLLYSEGVSMFNDDFSATNLTSPEAVAVLERQMQLFDQDITDRTVEVWDFPDGSIGMMTMASWYEADIRAGFGDDWQERVGVAPIPAGKDWRSLQYAFYFAVDANSPNTDEAWAFLTWLNQAQAEGEVSCAGEMLLSLGALTANTDDLEAAQDEFETPFTAPFVDALGRSITEPNVLQAAEIEGVLQRYIEQAWNGELSAEEALTRADAEISDILAEFY